MKMKRMAICTVLFLLFVRPGLAAVTEDSIIKDPVNDFLERTKSAEEKELMKLEADINGDGKKEVFLSRTDWRNGKAGFSWFVYIPIEGGYERKDEFIDFRTDALFIGECSEIVNGRALITSWPGGRGKVSLIAFQIVDGKIKRTSIHIEPTHKDKDRELCDRVFGKSKPPEIEKIMVRDLAGLTESSEDKMPPVFVEPKDLVKNYLTTYKPFAARIKDDALLRLETDLDGDGRNEVFLSVASAMDPEGSLGWIAYIPTQKGYKRWKQSVSFNPEKLYVGKCDGIEGLKGTALITYHPRSGFNGVAVAFQIKDEEIRKTIFKLNPNHSVEDEKLYDRLFKESQPPKIEKKSKAEVESEGDVKEEGKTP